MDMNGEPESLTELMVMDVQSVAEKAEYLKQFMMLSNRNAILGVFGRENNNISIKEASASRRRMYLWKCRNCGEEYRASVGYMLKEAVCPSCRKLY